MNREPSEPFTSGVRSLVFAQGVYFTATGIWPIVHMRSFEAVTGPKVDRWLVKTVGLCLACIGGTLLSAAKAGRITPEVQGLAMSTAAALTAVDIWYTARRRISPVYLCDAVCELALLAALSTNIADRTGTVESRAAVRMTKSS